MVDPYEEIGQETWEEIRLLERIIDDIKDLDLEDRISKINWFLNNQCEQLSPGHAKCRQRGGEVVPVWEEESDEQPSYVGCLYCGEMYRTEDGDMPAQFQEYRKKGAITVGVYDYDRLY
jgi:hypothetical protein